MSTQTDETNGSSKNWFKTASALDITILKRTASDDDADSMAYDNLAEVVKYENSVGRRDMTTVTGNAKPKLGEFYTALEERDTGAPEIITFTPPTGIYHEEVMNSQILIAVTAGLVIVVGGIVVIKKKVLGPKVIK